MNFKFMKKDTILNNDNQEAAIIGQDNYDIEIGFISIDAPVVDWRQRFPMSMLRIGHLLLNTSSEIIEVTAARISKLMDKHRDIIPGSYTPMQIRELLWHYPGEIRGGGIKVEWEEMIKPHRRNDPPHVSISFSRIYNPDQSKEELI